MADTIHDSLSARIVRDTWIHLPREEHMDLAIQRRSLHYFLFLFLSVFYFLPQDALPQPPLNQPPAEEFSLTLLHINDHHSHLKANPNGKIRLNQKQYWIEIGGFPRVVEKIKSLEHQNSNVVKIHAGDAITGTIYYSLFHGQADAELMNLVCFDLFVIGNHEFDNSDAGLKTFLDYLRSDSCQTQVLGANIIPHVGTPLAPLSSQDYIRPYWIKHFGQHKVAFIGIDIKGKTQLSSNPLETTKFLDELETAKKMIQRVKQEGVDKIVLATHYQYLNDIRMAQQLSDVDVIVGGDSHTLLGPFHSMGMNSQGDYPTEVLNADGDKVCIVQAWQYSYIVGELKVEFTADGRVKSCSGTPHLLIGKDFRHKIPEQKSPVVISAEELEGLQKQLQKIPQVSPIKGDEKAHEILHKYSQKIAGLNRQVIGDIEETLCMERIPGQGMSEKCSATATIKHGGDIQQVVAGAFLNRVNKADIAIINAGSVRTDLGAGELNIEKVYQLLPFANTLVTFQLTGREIKQLLEKALSFAINPNYSSGAFPYAAGLRWHIDFNQPELRRFSQLEVLTHVRGEKSLKNRWKKIKDSTTYTVVTNSYLAGGRDGYPLFGIYSKQGMAENTFLLDAEVFIQYVKEDLKGIVIKPQSSAYSTQKWRR